MGLGSLTLSGLIGTQNSRGQMVAPNRQKESGHDCDNGLQGQNDNRNIFTHRAL